MTLTVADIERWDAGSVREVFHAASSRAKAAADGANGLASLPAFASWGGVAASAAREAIGKTRKDLDAYGREAQIVANAARTAAEEIQRIKSDLTTLKADAASMGMEIDSVSGKVLPGRIVRDPVEVLLKEQQLRQRVDKIVAAANLVDMALANAIHMADGSVPIPSGPSGQVPKDPPIQDPARTGTARADSEVARQPVTAPAAAPDRSANQQTDDETDSTRWPLTAPIVRTDPSAVNQQRARVESARQTLDAAEAKLDAAAAQTYTQGGGATPLRGGTDALSQAVFDARRELTTQSKLLEDLNNAAAETGCPTLPVPDLPENADVQAFPAKPSAIAEGSRALNEGSFGLIPDVAKDVDIFTHWDKYSGVEQTGAVLDAAGMVPIPGAKGLTEGVAHGLDALNAARHLDEIPTSHHITDVPGSGHSTTTDAPHHAADASAAHHISSEAGHFATHGIEDTAALLAMSESSGGHLMERHVGQTVEDLSERLAAGPRPGMVSTFADAEEATTAITTALQHNQAAVDTWVTNGATERLMISVPFDGGEVLSRGVSTTVPGTSVLVVLQGIGNGRWIVLTGYPKP